jgi:predicted negative regulator of RcsB-dependent stress response
MRGKKYVIWFVFLAVLAVLAFFVLSNWQTSQKLSQVCEALFRSTNLTAVQNDPTNESLINVWKKECIE